MVQVLPYVPGFGEQLAQALGGAAGNIGQAYAEKIKKKRADEALDKMLNPQKKEASDAAKESGQQPQPGITAEGQPQGANSPIQFLNKATAEINPMKELKIFDLATKALGPKQADILFKSRHEQQKLAHQESIEERKAARKEASDLRKEEIEVHKLNKDYRDKLLDAYEGIKKTNFNLNRMEQLNNEDKLTTPAMAKISESLGIPLAVLANPESEQYQKLSQDLMSNITKVFGNRILEIEVENFLKTIPTLMNSKEGRKKIIENMKALQKPTELAYEAYKEIKKRGGKMPLDLHGEIVEMIGPKLDALAEQFKQGSGAIIPPSNAKEAEGFVVVTSPDGTKRWVPKDRLAEAIQGGGKL